MGKRKARPARYGVAIDQGLEGPDEDAHPSSRKKRRPDKEELVVYSQELDEERDCQVAEIVLVNAATGSGAGASAGERVRLRYLGIPIGICNYRVEDLWVEFVNSSSDSVLRRGQIDADDQVVASLVFLVRKQFVGLRTASCGSAAKVRVFITVKLLDEREPGHSLKRHVLRLLAWLRPEVSVGAFCLKGETEAKEAKPQEIFDPSRLYEALRRSRDEPCLEACFEELVTELRAYQKQAAYWMVQRERGHCTNPKYHPLWIPMDCLNKEKCIYFNILSGKFSEKGADLCSEVSGGVLADEMGLGKTVELLACILANRFKGEFSLERVERALEEELKQRKKERIDCVCGTENGEGIMIQCDICDSWQHATCIGYEPAKRGKTPKTARKWKQEPELLWDDDRRFVCGSCAEIISGVEVEGECGATLIICPHSILKQWQEEIIRHIRTGGLKVLVYEGVQKGCFTLGAETLAIKEVGAHHLAAADIVLASYDVFRSDIFHDIADGSRWMRFHKRYQVVATPLTKLRWWRVCLDEAQMVESQATSVTDMAMRLNARYRWCITGTPIQRGLDDLYGLLKFLRADPFDNRSWWTHAIRLPYEQGKQAAVDFAHSFLRDIMWRSTKSSVIDQLNIPAQDEKVSWLKLSRVEAYFYRRQHEQCAKEAQEVARKASSASALNFMKPLLRLRQACCHPQVGSSGIRALQGAPMPMDEILEVLITKAKTEGEEAQRGVFFSLNGLAGLALVEGNTQAAVSLYREALRIGEENATCFRVDPLQKYHILYNLSAILQEAEGIPRTLRDDKLLEQAEDIRQKYLAPYFSALEAAQREFYIARKKVSDLQSGSPWSNWWLDALSLVWKTKDHGQGFLDQMKQKLTERSVSINASSILLKFRDINGLKLLLQQELDAIRRSRDVLLGQLIAMDSKMDNPPPDYVKAAGLCAECQGAAGIAGIRCASCPVTELLLAYECRILLLFSTRTDKNGIVTVEEALSALGRASRSNKSVLNASVSHVQLRASPSETELILAMLLAHVKGRYSDEWVEGAKQQLHYLEVLREECQYVKKLHKAQVSLLGALSELYMHSLRTSLPGSAEYDLPALTVCLEEIPAKNAELTTQKFTALAELSRVKGQYRYLKGIAQGRTNSKGEDREKDADADAIAEEMCPICHEKLGSQAMVFPCGHLLCCNCMDLVVKRVPSKRIACASCRERAHVCDIAFAKTELQVKTGTELANFEDADDEESGIKVVGSYGTKIQAVVRRILVLKEKEPHAKILVFSTWQDVLDVLEHALKENKVLYARVKSKRKMNNAISDFKCTNVRVLLLPIQHGANGLNLIEAQHVVLVEPLLNPGAEAQAINRVHRIGQACKTFVHRFIVRDTVEESIYKMSQKKSSLLPLKQKEQPLTMDEISCLFSLDQANVEDESQLVDLLLKLGCNLEH